MKRLLLAACAVLLAAAGVRIFLRSSGASAPVDVQWRRLQPGVDLAVIGTHDPLYAVRIDPHRAHVEAALASESGSSRTAGAWCRTAGLPVAINLRMFQADGRSNAVYLRPLSHLNNAHCNAHRSAVAFY